jgi:hypothetical protein
VIKPRVFVFLFSLLAITSSHAQHFAKFFSFNSGNPYSNVAFSVACELKDSSGFLIIGNRSNPGARGGLIIKTDAAVNEIWTTLINFQGAPAPYNDAGLMDIMELPNGNYCVLGSAQLNSVPYYLLFIVDTAGNVVHDVVIREQQNVNPPGVAANIHPGMDSSIILAVGEYSRFGFYRLTQDLNLLSHTFFGNTLSGYGGDCIQLRDSNLLFTSSTSLTKTDTAGNILWSKKYSAGNTTLCLYESPSGSIYTGGTSNNNANEPALTKFDASGNPVFHHVYTLTTVTYNAPVYGIFPCDDHLMLYTDTALIVVDTLGNVVGWGKSIDALNSKTLKPANGDDFVLTGIIMQDSTGWYEYTLMKFDDSTSSGCLRPRTVVMNNHAITQTSAGAALQNVTVLMDTIPFTETHVNVGYDPLNGCPPAFVAILESSVDHELSVYPNPGTDAITVRNVQTGETISIVNALGETVYKRTADSPNHTVETGAWSNGLYFVLLPDRGYAHPLMFAVAH